MSQPIDGEGATTLTVDLDNPRPGDQIDEFRIIRPLGEGAFASVFLARQLTAQRLVALKIGTKHQAELVHLAKMDHRNIVRVYDHRTIADSDKSFLYLEYVPGGTLQDVIDEAFEISEGKPTGAQLLEIVDATLIDAGQPPQERSSLRDNMSGRSWPETVAWIGMHLAEALECAHQQDILHLDIKPANVLLASDGMPKLTDFNVSVATQGTSDSDRIGSGTIGYMAPEQLDAILGAQSGNAINRRTDLYGLAVLLWELLHGTKPWEADREASENRSTPAASVKVAEITDEIAVARSQREKTIATSGRFGQHAEALESLLLETLNVDSSKRPSSATEMAVRFRLVLHPKAGRILFPAKGSLRYRLQKIPVTVMCGLLLLVPNIAAGIFNFLYNEANILDEFPSMRSTFGTLATVVNAIAYPTAIILVLVAIRSLAKAMKRYWRKRQGGEETETIAEWNTNADQRERIMSRCWSLGQDLAIIGGSLWCLAGIVYPITMRWLHPEFPASDMVHFLLSLAICGGIAWTLPFFFGTVLGVFCYYPALLNESLGDDQFRRRQSKLKVRSGRFVLAAALLPLSAAALHTMRAEPSTLIIVSALAVTAAGLMAGFKIYQYLEIRINTLQEFFDG